MLARVMVGELILTTHCVLLILYPNYIPRVYLSIWSPYVLGNKVTRHQDAVTTSNSSWFKLLGRAAWEK